MNTFKIPIIGLFILCLLLSPVTPAFASNMNDSKPSAEEMLVDVFLVRPLGLVTTVIGTGFFGISLPFSIMGGNTVDVFSQLVIGPAAFTFARPVGELDY